MARNFPAPNRHCLQQPLTCQPPIARLRQQFSAGRQVMHAGFMAEDEAADLCFRIFGDPNAGVRLLAFVAAARFDQDFDIRLDEVEKIKAE